MESRISSWRSPLADTGGTSEEVLEGTPEGFRGRIHRKSQNDGAFSNRLDFGRLIVLSRQSHTKIKRTTILSLRCFGPSLEKDCRINTTIVPMNLGRNF